MVITTIVELSPRTAPTLMIVGKTARIVPIVVPLACLRAASMATAIGAAALVNSL